MMIFESKINGRADAAEMAMVTYPYRPARIGGIVPRATKKW